jgi:hypothetical protein
MTKWSAVGLIVLLSMGWLWWLECSRQSLQRSILRVEPQTNAMTLQTPKAKVKVRNPSNGRLNDQRGNTRPVRGEMCSWDGLEVCKTVVPSPSSFLLFFVTSEELQAFCCFGFEQTRCIRRRLDTSACHRVGFRDHGQRPR